ncbi:MAG: type I methionyl aminopeptidase, partial [Chloroflexi bacterium]
MGMPAGTSMVTIKRPEEIARMRHAGSILVEVLDAFGRELRAGMSTAELDVLAEEMIRAADAVPSFLGYRGFPRSICVSINDEVVHGIPSPRRHLHAGDVVGLDIGCIWQGWHADCARTFSIGEPAPRVQELIEATRGALDAGIAAAIPGNRLGDVGAAIEAIAHEHGYGIVRPFVGHGIGTEMHESPNVPNYGRAGTGMRIEAGMCFAIEPMFNLGDD